MGSILDPLVLLKLSWLITLFSTFVDEYFFDSLYYKWILLYELNARLQLLYLLSPFFLVWYFLVKYKYIPFNPQQTQHPREDNNINQINRHQNNNQNTNKNSNQIDNQ